MAGMKNTHKDISETDLQGFAYFREILPLLKKHAATKPHSNRDLQADQYIMLILFYFFNPVLTSLRGICKATDLEKLQKKLGIKRTSLSSLSEASQVFDAQLLEPVLQQLARRALPIETDPQLKRIQQDILAVDGTLLQALPKMLWALWLDGQHRAAKLHLAFDIAKGLPVDAAVTHANASEKNVLKKKFLKPDTLFLLDAGFARYELLNDITAANSSFVVRIRDNAVWDCLEQRPLTEQDRQAGITKDMVVRLGSKKTRDDYPQPVRLLELFHKGDESVRRTARVSSKKTFRTIDPDYNLLLATDQMDLSAETIVLLYRYRWQIELFFRWFKCILGCTHLLAHSQNGITIQVYCALIASMLITLWTGRKPTKRTFEMLNFYFLGWATLEELQQHINGLKSAENH